MRKTSIGLLIASSILLAVSCKSIPEAKLIPIDMGEARIVDAGEVAWQASSNEDVEVVMQSGFAPDNTQAILAAGITNKTGDTLGFSEDDIVFYGRRKSGDGEWNRMGEWDKNHQVLRAILWKTFDVFKNFYTGHWMAIFGTEKLMMGDGDAMLQISDLGEPYGNSLVNEVNYIKRYSLGWLGDNALVDGDTAAPGKELVGAFFMTPKKRYTEFKVEYTPQGSNDHFDFYYERSDAEYVENPWLDNPYKRVDNILNLSYSPLDNGLGISFSTLHPTPGGIGFRLSINSRNLFNMLANLPDGQESMQETYPHLKDWGPDATFNDAILDFDSLQPSGLDVSLGLTIKAAPYTWVIVGGNFLIGPLAGFAEVTFRPHEGEDYVKYPEKVFMVDDVDKVPFSGGVTLGIDCAVYFMNFFATGTYDFLRNVWMMDVGAGVNI